MAGEINKITLLELNRLIREGISGLFSAGTWVVAEISDMSVNQSGHCYLELIEKAEKSEQITARAKATIWSFTYRILRPYFESVTREKLRPGIKVLLQVSVEFHELYGLSLNIKDIEPNFTLGDMARRRQEIIDRLTREGVMEMNKELELPVLCQRIAVISSETAAGYGDFVKQLKNNSRGFKFRIKLFQAFMQGDETEKSVIGALERIFLESHNFDLVVIIRGGGAQSELNYFNNYNIAFHITQFPLPVFSGIGHDRDQTIADLVSHTSLKTPTAVAEYLLSLMEETANYLEELSDNLISRVTESITIKNDELERMAMDIQQAGKWQINRLQTQLALLGNTFEQRIHNLLPRRLEVLNRIRKQVEAKARLNLLRQKMHLNSLNHGIPLGIKNIVKREKSRLLHAQTLLTAYDPVNILKRGYSITLFQGKSLRHPQDVSQGDILVTRLAEGNISSTVKE